MELFDPTPETLTALERTVSEIPAIQSRLVERDGQLRHGDRVAHQQQIAGSLVRLRIADTLPRDIAGIGLFVPGSEHLGIGRISNGLGCPHIETNPDFLGIMLAFRSGTRRVDFLGINDPSAPTDTVEEFIALLAATAEAAGVDVPFGAVGQLDLGNLTAGQLAMFRALRRRLGIKRATRLYAHVARQTARTLLSSSAFQPYWTGVVRLGDSFGKFTLVPADGANQHRSIRPGERYLTEDWRHRQSNGDLEFQLYWIPYLDEHSTPLEQLTRAWSEEQRRTLGAIVFPRIDPDSRDAKLVSLLAFEMGGNPGNWLSSRDPAAASLPPSAFEAGRALAYRRSQEGRMALPEESYAGVFSTGVIDPALTGVLLDRYRANRLSGHPTPDLGDLA